jgi:hypothetical protein
MTKLLIERDQLSHTGGLHLSNQGSEIPSIVNSSKFPATIVNSSKIPSSIRSSVVNPMEPYKIVMGESNTSLLESSSLSIAGRAKS